MLSNQKHSQTFLPGMVTAQDVIRDHYRQIGSKGGKTNSPKQTANRRKMMQAINAKKWGKNDDQE